MGITFRHSIALAIVNLAQEPFPSYGVSHDEANSYRNPRSLHRGPITRPRSKAFIGHQMGVVLLPVSYRRMRGGRQHEERAGETEVITGRALIAIWFACVAGQCFYQLFTRQEWSRTAERSWFQAWALLLCWLWLNAGRL